MTHKHILFVEDNTDAQEFVTLTLEDMGFAVSGALNGEDALAMIDRATCPFDAFVIDLALPGKDGWALLRDIRANPATATVPCVAVTGFHNYKMRETALEAGFAAYFPKPFDTMELGHELERLVDDQT